jgi:hypothetical protein
MLRVVVVVITTSKLRKLYQQIHLWLFSIVNTPAYGAALQRRSAVSASAKLRRGLHTMKALWMPNEFNVLRTVRKNRARVRSVCGPWASSKSRRPSPTGETADGLCSA